VSSTADIWLDQDPGCDDSVALFMALFSPKIIVKGMTITGGNVGLNHCLLNAKNLLNAFGRSDVPVYIGSALPITKWSFSEEAAEGYHGENGLALKIQDYLKQLPAPIPEVGKTLTDLYNGLKGLTTPVNYFVTGPCTTLALLIKVFPDVMEKIERIIIMGGSFSNGNITPYAEFNTFCDPESYQVLLGCPLEKIVFGLEPLHMLGYDMAFIDTIRENPSSLSWLVAECYQQVYTSHFKAMEE
jgi:inosine-uridine nucleoside N-ribohydrolase